MSDSNPTLSFGRIAGSQSAAGLSFPSWIGLRAARHGDRPAVVFLDDEGSSETWTYNELWWRACELAQRLPVVEESAPRALLLFPPGLDAIAALIGCQLAGWVPVPTCYPRAGRELPRLNSVAADCAPAAIIGDQGTLAALNRDNLSAAARDLPAITVARSSRPDDAIELDAIKIDPESLAFLQYTSGSTSEPKGVKVLHRNLMANLESIRVGFDVGWQPDTGIESDCGVFWLPFYHDMGLIGGALTPLYIGGCTVMMSPRTFLQRPFRWLQAISDYRAVVTAGPNFAYQLCVDRITPEQADTLDLSRWRTALCGAEPVLARTMTDFANRFSASGFDPTAFCPCYGLAEATVFATGVAGTIEPRVLNVQRESLGSGEVDVSDAGRGRAWQKLVSCGRPSPGTEVLIVDPESCQRRGEREVGEIWLRGDGVTAGYWRTPADNPFDAELADGDRGFLRTGDLGFLHDGELYVTGRRKDVIIIRGRNHFPQDIEQSVRQTIQRETENQPHAGLCAAFATQGPRGEALTIVAELPRRLDESAYSGLVRSIRRDVIDVHEIDPSHILLVRQTTIPLTSSGKIQRSRCRALFDRGELPSKHRYDRASSSDQAPIPIPDLPSSPAPDDLQEVTAAIENWMTEWLVIRAGVTPGKVEIDKPFAEYGLDSLTAVELSGELEDWSGIELTPMVAWNHPTVALISGFTAAELVGAQHSSATATAAGGDDDELGGGNRQPESSVEKLQGLIDQIEQLADREADHAVADKRRS